jgi:hypothetical protein
LLNTNLVLLLQFLDAMGCDPDRYQDSILNAEGWVWQCPQPFAQFPIVIRRRLTPEAPSRYLNQPACATLRQTVARRHVCYHLLLHHGPYPFLPARPSVP